MHINQTDPSHEVRAALEKYEKSLTNNDVVTVSETFWNSPHTVRFGPEGSLFGFDAIYAFRASRSSGPPPREEKSLRVTTFGDDFAVTHTEFRYPGQTRVGRTSQTWARIEGQWRIVSAHVSFAEDERASSGIK